MSDEAAATAAFFAKKKKKKSFKGFNANKIDVASVTNTVHVDAPALSKDSEVVTEKLATTTLEDKTSDNAAETQWDDKALAATLTRKQATAAIGTSGGSTTAELLDMKALDSKRRDQDDIAERMRLEETKAALAAAREGMEREAQRLKEEKDEPKTTGSSGSRFGAAAAAAGDGKWVPPHMRSGMSRMRVSGGTFPQKLDTQDENLFPDLAAADAILEKEKKHDAAVYKVPKKTPVGGGATWGSRPPVKRTASPPPPKEEPVVKAEEPQATVEPTPAPPVVSPEPAKPSVEPAKPSVGAGLKKKKKKKDLSTFKASA